MLSPAPSGLANIIDQAHVHRERAAGLFVN